MIAELAAELKREAERADERRLIVIAGDRAAGIDAAYEVVSACGIADTDVTMISSEEGFRFDECRPRGAGALLGRTREIVVLDAHDRFVPNALGAAAGAVDGGGLLVLLAPELDDWPQIRDGFDESLAVPPFGIKDVTGRFRKRLVETIRSHPGIAVVSMGGPTGGDTGDEGGACVTVQRDGLTDPPSATARSTLRRPANASFPHAVYAACLTADQARAVRTLEALATPGSAVVMEADRGRGKSSAAGLAAAALARTGSDVLVTAPEYRNAGEVFARASEQLSDPPGRSASSNDVADRAVDERTTIETAAGGSIRYLPPAEAAALPGEPDCVIVDEAAALPVGLLERFLAAPSVAFCTTVHGYEGAGRGFSVRFRERLADADLVVRDVRLHEPIRYAPDDPVERWVFRALCLDARPVVDEAITGAEVTDARYRRLDPDDLIADENLLSTAFGLLVAAHYRTEPNDLARLLDAPNLSARALLVGDHVVSIALLAREGALPSATRAAMYEGERVRGNMVPDVLTSQLRDEGAADALGVRVVRIATHHVVRGRGFGSTLLAGIHDELVAGSDGYGVDLEPTDFEPTDHELIDLQCADSTPSDGTDGREAGTAASKAAVDYVSVGYGATPRLLRFWRRAGYRMVHLSTTRNDRSGEHSAIMIRPLTAAGEALLDRHAVAFRDRERDALSDAHRDVDVDVVRGALRACSVSGIVDLTDHEWRVVVAAAYGPGMYDVAPGAFRDLALAALLEAPALDLTVRQRRLLVRKVLQGHPWETVADELGYVSTRACMRSLGAATKPLVERYGTDIAHRERTRFGNG